jgi:phospholipid-transporting ATPase
MLHRDFQPRRVRSSLEFPSFTDRHSSETNLKIKQASPQTHSLTSPSLASALHGTLRSEQPNNSLYTYEGTLELLSDMNVPKTVPLGPDQMLLRGAQLRNTPWVYGIVVFTGHETKLMRNAT